MLGEEKRCNQQNSFLHQWLPDLSPILTTAVLLSRFMDFVSRKWLQRIG